MFCSFLALVLKAELELRIMALGRDGSWSEILADLNSLTETEIAHDGRRFLVRAAPHPAASLALRAAGVALPPTVQPLRRRLIRAPNVVPRRNRATIAVRVQLLSKSHCRRWA